MDRRTGERLLLVVLTGLALLFVAVLCWYALGGGEVGPVMARGMW